MTLGDRIRAARESKGMTLDELGKRCNTTRQTINKYEQGTVTNIPLDRVELIAAALEVSPAYLLNWNDEPAISPAKAKIADITKDMSDEQLLDIIRYAEFIKQRG